MSEEERRAATESWNRREIKDYPNLLELSKSVLRTVMLQVHYRSAYRELIAFSNNAFYHRALVPPSNNGTHCYCHTYLRNLIVDWAASGNR